MNKKILFISYVFPPTGGAGIQRTVKLVKYFHKLGWNPYILTAKNPSVPVFDYEIVKDVPADAKIYKSLSLEIPYALKRKLWGGTVKNIQHDKPNEDSVVPSKSLKQKILGSVKFLVHLLMMPDPQIGWNFFTVRKAKKIIKKHKIGHVFISAPPFSSLLLIPALSKLNVKLVADFRDEWTEFYLKSYDFHQRDNYTTLKIIKMEQEVIDSADLVTMATSSFVTNYGQKYNTHQNKIKLLTNGYDVDDFKNKPGTKRTDHKFNITYTGTIFNVTTAKYLLNAVSELINENPRLEDQIQLNFVGRITDEEQVFFDQFVYKNCLNFTGYIPHLQSVSYLYQSDLLVVIVDDLDGSDRIIAAKVFEYIYTGIPILALVPETGEIAQIVNSTGTGIVISNRKTNQIKATIMKFLNKQTRFDRNEQEIKQYSREDLAKQLINYLEEIQNR